ncbi:polyprenol reductase [Neocloeon triangulifer]|uniref:polyprenol reductase n=1 Tax=Neocloeon triangulifer TaxID=2078957 RepID=UPI00286F8D43|nr:polyprenol reductase [Neocloeon triangulifer]
MELPAILQDLPHLKVILAIMTVTTLVLGLLVNLLEPYLPAFVIQALRYGKFAYKGPKQSWIKPIEFPKSYFKHFYYFAAFYTSYITYLTFFVYYGNASVPHWFIKFLDLLASSKREATVSSGRVLVALLLLSLQCWRRLYETTCVSVFSSGKINLAQYLAGFFHYLFAAAAIVAEAPVFASKGKRVSEDDGLSAISIAAVGIFLWAFIHQYRTAVILADLRKDGKGKVVTTKHRIPEGDWFEAVSSPHLLAEILMYLTLTMLLWNNTCWLFILVWVLVNQIETALLSHWWYKDTFKDYPKERRALIPWIF